MARVKFAWKCDREECAVEGRANDCQLIRNEPVCDSIDEKSRHERKETMAKSTLKRKSDKSLTKGNWSSRSRKRERKVQLEIGLDDAGNIAVLVSISCLNTTP